MLDGKDLNMILEILRSLNRILAVGEVEGKNLFIEDFESFGGITALEKLEETSNIEIYNAAKEILEAYYYIMDTQEIALMELSDEENNN